MPLKLEIAADTQPLARPFARLQVGDRCDEHCRLTAAGFEAFARVSGDTAPVHVDDTYARGVGFERRILPGFYTSLRFSRLLGMFVPGPLSVIHSTRFEYHEPLYLDEDDSVPVSYTAAVSRLIEALRAVVIDLEARKGDRVLVRGTGQCVMKQ